MYKQEQAYQPMEAKEDKAGQELVGNKVAPFELVGNTKR